jgi:SAM-dependent methyltransferase
MKHVLLDLLTCPACLPDERPLQCAIDGEIAGDILAGALTCSHCHSTFPIIDGLACLVPPQPSTTFESTSKYETDRLLSSYLWSHYADLFGDEDANTAYQTWSATLDEGLGLCLDAGCAVGRFAFEMTQKSDFVVAVDLSRSFVDAARELMNNRQMTFSLPVEGLLRERKNIHPPAGWHYDRIEFLLADVQALPFPAGSFGSVTSLNIVDKVPQPFLHLSEMNRVARIKKAQMLFSDPFSWSEEISDAGSWLGGTREGEFEGRGFDNVLKLLKGEKKGLEPAWNIDKQGELWWKIRTHSNHFEMIRSCFVKARR